MTLPAGFLDRLRQKVKVSDVASRWVKWDARKSNSEKGDFWGCCPFHDEKVSSFHVDDIKGFYYCFGCQAKGDIFTLLREKGGLSFIQSVRQLAFIGEMDDEISPKEGAVEDRGISNILQMKDIIVQHFTQENFLEIGVISGWTNQIRNHSRLLRSLSWGDPDYPGHVLDLLTQMD